ncbi:MAG: pilin [Patescibacteria group bacterium]
MLTSLIEKVYAQSPDANQLGTAISISSTNSNIGDIVNNVITWIIYIVGVLAFIYLVVSGITYITAGGNAEQAKKGQQGIINSVIGIVIVVLAYVILTAVSNTASSGTIQ